MIWSVPSDSGDRDCPHCGGPASLQPLHPYPVFLQILFGLSFVVFLFVFERIQSHRIWIWLWSVVQMGLGAALIRRRLRAKKRILRCIRCNQELR